MNDRNDSDARLVAHTPDPIPDPHAILDWIRLQPDLFSDESLAPEIDLGLLRSLVRRELAEADERLVHRLTICFESWRDAHNEILTKEFLREKNLSG
jgi:hypothetical protein